MKVFRGLRNLPSKSIIALRSEEIYMILELQLKDKLLADAVLIGRLSDCISNQRERRQGEVILVGLVEEEAEVREDHPELLPAVAVLEFAQQETTQLVLEVQNS